MSCYRKQKSTLPSRTSSSATTVKRGDPFPPKSTSVSSMKSALPPRTQSSGTVKTLPFVGVSVVSHLSGGNLQGYDGAFLDNGGDSETKRSYYEKSLDIPQPNSSRSHEKLIAQAIKDISKLPGKIEQVVSQKMVDPEFQKTQSNSATKKLNVPKSARIYRNLLDIESVAPPPMKPLLIREQKQIDASPELADYLRPQYVRTKPQTPPLVQKKETTTQLIDLNDFVDENDLLRFERAFSCFS